MQAMQHLHTNAIGRLTVFALTQVIGSGCRLRQIVLAEHIKALSLGIVSVACGGGFRKELVKQVLWFVAVLGSVWAGSGAFAVGRYACMASGLPAPLLQAGSRFIRDWVWESRTEKRKNVRNMSSQPYTCNPALLAAARVFARFCR